MRARVQSECWEPPIRFNLGPRFWYFWPAPYLRLRITVITMAFAIGHVSGFIQGWALTQLWLFWAAPLLGGAIGALLYRLITPEWFQAAGDKGGPGT
jgi:hypothetical protein